MINKSEYFTIRLYKKVFDFFFFDKAFYWQPSLEICMDSEKSFTILSLGSRSSPYRPTMEFDLLLCED